MLWAIPLLLLILFEIIADIFSKEWVLKGHWETVYESVWVDDGKWSSSCNCYSHNGHWEEVSDRKWVKSYVWETFYSNGSFKFDNISESSKDLELLAAIDETENQNFISQYFFGGGYFFTECGVSI